MGTQTSARLMYGVALPDDIEDDQLDEVLASDPQFAGLGHAWAGTWNGGTRYLTAYCRSAALGTPETILTFDLNPVHATRWNPHLRAAWTAFGLSIWEMPTPNWILAANST